MTVETNFVNSIDTSIKICQCINHRVSNIFLYFHESVIIGSFRAGFELFPYKNLKITISLQKFHFLRHRNGTRWQLRHNGGSGEQLKYNTYNKNFLPTQRVPSYG